MKLFVSALLLTGLAAFVAQAADRWQVGTRAGEIVNITTISRTGDSRTKTVQPLYAWMSTTEGTLTNAEIIIQCDRSQRAVIIFRDTVFRSSDFKVPVTLTVDGVEFNVTAINLNSIGRYFEYQVRPIGKLLKAVKSGSSLKVVFFDETLFEVGLRGSSAAITSVQKSCG